MLNYYRDKLNERIMAKRINENTLQDKEHNLSNILDTYNLTTRTQKLMQECAEATLSGISVRISKIVTNAIKAVFQDTYEFNLDFDIKYGRLSASMYLIKDGEYYDPTLDNGDGVVDIIALALRTAALCLDKRQLRRVLILDEPCGALSVDKQPYAGKLMQHLHETLGIQFIIVGAHGNAYMEYADKIFDFNSVDFNNKVIL